MFNRSVKEKIYVFSFRNRHVTIVSFSSILVVASYVILKYFIYKIVPKHVQRSLFLVYF